MPSTQDAGKNKIVCTRCGVSGTTELTHFHAHRSSSTFIRGESFRLDANLTSRGEVSSHKTAPRGPAAWASGKSGPTGEESDAPAEAGRFYPEE
jgi:hypothetical protein